MSAEQAIDDVLDELERQDEKWGQQDWPDGTGPTTVWEFTGPADWVRMAATQETDRLAETGHVTFRDILLEEVAEAFAEADPAKLRAELVQVAAVAVQWVGAIDRRAGCRHCGEPIIADGVGGWTHPRGPGSSLIRCQPPAPYGTDAAPR